MNLTGSEQYIGYLVADLARLMRSRFIQRAMKIGLSRGEWLVLAWLRRNEGISQAGLAKIMEISPMTAVRLIDKLEAAGLVERRRQSKDRRNHYLYLSPRAHPQLQQLWTLADETRGEALAGIAKADVLQLVEILTNMRENMKKTTMPAARKPAKGERSPGLPTFVARRAS